MSHVPAGRPRQWLAVALVITARGCRHADAIAFRVVLDGPNAATLPARCQTWRFAGGHVIGPLPVQGR